MHYVIVSYSYIYIYGLYKEYIIKFKEYDWICIRALHIYLVIHIIYI